MISLPVYLWLCISLEPCFVEDTRRRTLYTPTQEGFLTVLSTESPLWHLSQNMLTISFESVCFTKLYQTTVTTDLKVLDWKQVNVTVTKWLEFCHLVTWMYTKNFNWLKWQSTCIIWCISTWSYLCIIPRRVEEIVIEILEQ